MSILKRLSATFVSRVDEVVSEIENHDAVIQATMNEVRKKVAKARVGLSQVQREEQNLQGQLIDQQKNAVLWRGRAVKIAESDENKAFDCLRRARQCENSLARLEKAITQYAQTSERLERDIMMSEERLLEMKQKLILMRARESSGCALSASSEVDNNVVQQLDNSFDRWEINLRKMEMCIEDADPADSLEREFISHEEEAELRNELKQLLGKGGEK